MSMPSRSSEREAQVLALAELGLTDRQIADRMFLSEATIGTYWRRVMAKLNASTRTQAVAITLRAKIDEQRRQIDDMLTK